MYSNVFDTVRTNNPDAIGFESLLYTSILNGLHPTFSLTQAIDSKSLVQMIKADKKSGGHFLNFFKNGRIRVALYGDYCNFDNNKEFRGPISKYLYDRLNSNVVSPGSFVFSSMPFLSSGGSFDTRQLTALFQCMRDSIIIEPYEKSENPCNKFVKLFDLANEKCRFPLTEDEYNSILNHFDAVYEIEKAIGRSSRYYKASTSSSHPDLRSRFENHCKTIVESEEGKDSELIVATKELQKMYQSHRNDADWKKKRNRRGFLYKLISELGGNNTVVNQTLKSCVDLCYNEVVAASIEDGGESDIIVYNNNGGYSLLPDNHFGLDYELDRVSETMGLLEKTKSYEKKVFTWQIMDDLFEKIDPEKMPISEWRDAVQEYCSGIVQNRVRLESGRLFRGAIFLLVSALATYKISYYISDTIDKLSAPARILPGTLLTAVNLYIGKLYGESQNRTELPSSEKAILEMKDKLQTQVSTLIRDINTSPIGGNGYVK